MTNKIAIVTGGSRGLGRNPAVNPARQRGVDTCDFMQESHEYSVIKSVRAPRPLLFAATSPNARKGGYYCQGKSDGCLRTCRHKGRNSWKTPMG